MLLFAHPLSATDYAEIGLPVIELYDSFAHQGGNQNWKLVQAENGLIYNGGSSGLTEWDGEKWSSYHTPQKSRIRSISIWKDANIYVGTTNDIGYYYPNKSGTLVFQSLLNDWSFEEKQFGEIWYTAANSHGVMFLSKQSLMFWDGQSVQKVPGAPRGSYPIFSNDDEFYFKSFADEELYTITFKPSLTIEKVGITFPKRIALSKILRNKNKHLTFITDQDGIFEWADNKLTQKLHFKDFPEYTHIVDGIQARDGYYYLATLYNGVFILNSDYQLVKNYTQDHGLGTNTLLSVMEDFQGAIWFSGEPNIIKMMPPHHYSHYDTDSQINGLENISIINNKVTVTGISVVQIEPGPTPLQPAYFKNIHTRGDVTWEAIAYENHLLYAGSGGIYAMEYTDNNQLVNHQKILKTPYARNFAIDDKTHTLFATSSEGLFRLNYQNNNWQIKKVPDIEDELHYITIENGIIWIGTSTQELYRIENAQYDEKETIIDKFIDKDGLGFNNVVTFNNSLGVVFGTNDGLMNYEKDRQPQLQFLNYLPEIFHSKGMDVYRLYEDELDNIWYKIGSRTGYLSKNDKNQWVINEDVFRYFSSSGYKGFVKSDKNTLWFCMADGEIFRADTQLLEKLPPQGRLNIRRVVNLDNEQEIFGGTGKVHLPVLTQKTNSIRINFALADNSIANPRDANQVVYRHRLLGSSHENFSKWSSESHKDFTLLKGNDYQFEVEAKDAWGRIARKDFSYKVLPPWYLSTIAWLIYALVALLFLIISSWLTQKWRTTKLNQRNIELEKEVQERIAEVQEKADEIKLQHELKDRFFTNVSHEFRTPLTLTIAPLEAFLIDNKDLDLSLLKPIDTALRNSKKMLSLVGQVLDINRLESGRFPLHVAQFDVSDLINNLVNRFTVLAAKQKQKLSTVNTENPHMLYFDQDQLDKCISNLVANAIKYSGENSCIEISIIPNENQTGIMVSDNGKGISPAFEAKIFERFTQDEESEKISEPGTGIGLALVQELMELHHGKVQLKNKQGAGCAFILWLKKGSQHFDQSQLIEPITKNTDSIKESLEISAPQQITINSLNSGDITTILVVDDNQELREFITSRFSNYYRIIQASDGQEGYNIALSNLPDLIISDVMMPVMDGLDMTKTLKNNPYTKTIPIILLTAKSNKREVVTGLQSGADDYLTKPFDTSELVIRANGLINNRKLIRKTIKAQLCQQITHLDKTSQFIDKLRNEILLQLSDPKLSVESLSSAMAMSRHTLNRKCKSELDKTTVQIITETRMQHALSLLKLNKHSISEIAYGIGYDSLAYFSRTFKKHYGKTPSEIRQA